MPNAVVRPDAAVPTLEVRHAVKRFGAVLAIDGVSLAAYAGEVLALLGDNGAGKSTLIKCISGVHRLDSGSIEIDGVASSLHSPADARRAGIETVYQDLALFDNMDATANFYAGRELASPRWLPRSLRALNERQMDAATRDLLDRLKVVLPSFNAHVGLMSGGQRQAVAVARAAAFAKKLVILDEPTAALGVRESRQVLSLIERLRDQGNAVILITHNMDQVVDIANRAMVMRRGRKVGEVRPSASTRQEIVSMIVGA
ncbi:MAG: ATP-binding cassette domain-containing protein [Devosia sp.]